MIYKAFIITLLAPIAFATMPADPRPFKKKQPNGEWVSLRFNGDGHFHYLTDENGFTVVEDRGYDVYAELNETTGELESTGRRVGKVNPAKIGLRKKTLPSKKVIEEKCGDFCKSHHKDHHGRKHDGRQLSISNGVLKNLVVLICFSDHSISDQPVVDDYDILFNSEGVDNLYNSKNVQIARTGSIKDVLLTSSYENLKLESEIYQWVRVSKPESYYADGNSGLNTRLHEAMTEALGILDNNGFNWLDFDQDRDGIIDAVTFLHSGYGAEFGGVDCNNKDETDRIWSHKWAMRKWTSRTINNREVAVSRYHISPGKWGTCGSAITRIGVIAHETGHFLGLEDYCKLFLYSLEKGCFVDE